MERPSTARETPNDLKAAGCFRKHFSQEFLALLLVGEEPIEPRQLRKFRAWKSAADELAKRLTGAQQSASGGHLLDALDVLRKPEPSPVLTRRKRNGRKMRLSPLRLAMVPILLLLTTYHAEPQTNKGAWRRGDASTYRSKDPAHPWVACNEFKPGTLLEIEHKGVRAIAPVQGTGPFAVNRHGRALRPLRPHPTRKLDMNQRLRGMFPGRGGVLRGVRYRKIGTAKRQVR